MTSPSTTLSSNLSGTAYCGRFAPSPTGALHAGSLFTAVASWLRARQAHGRWLVRMDDIDAERTVPGSATAILATLARCGLVSDAPVMYASQRDATYQAAFDRLRATGQVFPCWCTHGAIAAHGGVHQDGHCLVARDPTRPPAWRLRVPHEVIAFDDRLQGPQQQNLRADVGDFVVRRADGTWAYQLACVVDDAAQGITETVRGVDLLESTPRQIHLQRLLGLPTPRYAHLPLLVDGNGRKWSKSTIGRDATTTRPDVLMRRILAMLGAPAETVQGATLPGLLRVATTWFDLARLTGLSALSWP